MDLTTRPCPADRDAPITPRSSLADVAMAAGIPAEDVRAFVAGRYRLVRSDIGLIEVQP